MGSTIFIEVEKVLEVFRFVRGAEDVGVGGVGLLGRHFVAEAGLLHEGRHLGAKPPSSSMKAESSQGL